MAYVIEDGSIVTGANSFVTDTEYVTYATQFQYTESDATKRETAAVKAYAMLVDSYEHGISGTRVSIDQTGMMPRRYMTVRGFSVPSDAIPQDFKVAQMMLMANIIDGATTNSFVAGSVSTAGSGGGALTGFEVPGVYKETYSSSSSGTTATSNVLAAFPAVSKLLAPYYADSDVLVRT